MLEILAFVIATILLPVLIDKSVEGRRLVWMKAHLREMWTAVFVFSSIYLLKKPEAMEIAMKLHKRWQELPILSYILVGSLGALILCGYWWLTGKLFATSLSQAPPASEDGTKRPPSAAEIAEELSKRLPKVPVIETRTETAPEIELVFKNSELFTNARKASLTREVNAFYRYLTKIGFRISKEIPPLGTHPGRANTAVYMEPGSVYESAMSLPEDRIDDPDAIAYLYAGYVFHRFFSGPPSPQTRFNTLLIWLYSGYYVPSFRGKYTIDSGSGLADWKNALWDIRTTFGKDYADRLLFYCYDYIKQYPPQPKDTFDEFVWLKFMAGLHVIDNNRQDEPRVIEILKARGLPRQTPPQD